MIELSQASIESAELNYLSEKIIVDDLLAEKIKFRIFSCSEIFWIAHWIRKAINAIFWWAEYMVRSPMKNNDDTPDILGTSIMEYMLKSAGDKERSWGSPIKTV